MSQARALIVDDEPDIRELLELTLERMSVRTKSAANFGAACAAVKSERFDLCLTDMRLPDGNGLDLVEFIATHAPSMPVAVITAHGSVDAAVAALKAGAFDFVSKPLDLEVLRGLVRAALKLGESRTSADRCLVGDSAQMLSVRATIAKLARSQAPVYVSGESGTGKELVARMIHEQGPRSSEAFVPVNCGAIPSELMESELFGHKRGSFTGAVSDNPGLFKSADGGTLFLDEVADLPLAMQVKLLRAIQEKQIRPVGAATEVPVDVRILSASHSDLNSLVLAGGFRQDLYYRLNVINLHVPPLRERGADIPILCEHILTRLCADAGCAPHELTADALGALTKYPFPGNVRELENLLERALTLCESTHIGADELGLPTPQPTIGDNSASDWQVGVVEDGGAALVDPSSDASSSRNISQPSGQPGQSLEAALETVEKQLIVDALERSRWNKTATAKRLGISFGALRYRMQKLGLD